MRPGDTFLSNVDGGHLWVIVIEPDESGEVVCATFTTRRDREDGTFVAREPCAPALLRKVRDGIVASEFTPKYIRAALAASHRDT